MQFAFAFVGLVTIGVGFYVHNYIVVILGGLVLLWCVAKYILDSNKRKKISRK